MKIKISEKTVVDFIGLSKKFLKVNHEYQRELR